MNYDNGMTYKFETMPNCSNSKSLALETFFWIQLNPLPPVSAGSESAPTCFTCNFVLT